MSRSEAEREQIPKREREEKIAKRERERERERGRERRESERDRKTEMSDNTTSDRGAVDILHSVTPVYSMENE